jgi:DNA-directed RNA polymerase specialized sigma24 family protein
MLDVLRAETCDTPSADAVARALAALTAEDLLRLKRLAQLRARVLPGVEWDDLLNEALLRALDGSREWPKGVSLLTFLGGIMRSLVDVRVAERRRRMEHILRGEENSVMPPDVQIHARQCLAAFTRRFADDADVLVLVAVLAGLPAGAPGAAIAFSNHRRWEAARKRLRRAILRGELDGFRP